MKLEAWVVERPDGVEIRIHVQPRASKTEIVGLYGEELKIRIAASPLDGRANAELRIFLAWHCGVSPQSVQIITGLKSRRKRVFITGQTLAAIQKGLNNDDSPDD